MTDVKSSIVIRLMVDLRFSICPRAVYRPATAPSGANTCDYQQGEVSRKGKKLTSTATFLRPKCRCKMPPQESLSSL